MVRTLATAVSIALFWANQAVAADLSVEVEIPVLALTAALIFWGFVQAKRGTV